MCDQLIIATVHYTLGVAVHGKILEWEKLGNLVNCELFANIFTRQLFLQKI